LTKLHEILAIEAGVKSTADSTLNEAVNTFTRKHEHFNGQTRKYTPLQEDGMPLADEHKPVVSTVKEKLDYVQDHLVRALDCLYQKEFANTLAKADIILGSTVILNVPATILLNFEKKFKEIRAMYQTIPTLDPGREWIKDTSSANIYVSLHDTESIKTDKTTIPVILAPATDKHPAQVKEVNKDIPVGKWNTIYRSGSITPLEKSQLLAKIDIVIRELTQARQRANDQVVEKITIAEEIFAFINS